MPIFGYVVIAVTLFIFYWIWHGKMSKDFKQCLGYLVLILGLIFCGYNIVKVMGLYKANCLNQGGYYNFRHGCTYRSPV